MKKCTKCKINQSLNNYYKFKHAKDEKQSWCKSCVSTIKKEWNLKYPEKIRANNVRNAYGITLEEYDAYMSTSNKCEICSSKEKLCYDHCHDRNVFRGVLCGRCNTGIGYFKDSKKLLLKAIYYLIRR